jgi:hypothetical protein
VGEHRLQVVEVDEQQPLGIRDVEGDRQHALLHLVQIHQPGEQQRPHLADGGADRMTLFAVKVPELHGIVGIGPIRIADLRGAGGEGLMRLRGRRSGHREAGEVALHVGDEAGHADLREPLDDPLQRHRLAGTRRARDQAVAVGASEVETLRVRPALARADEDAVRHVARSRGGAPVIDAGPRKRKGPPFPMETAAPCVTQR